MQVGCGWAEEELTHMQASNTDRQTDRQTDTSTVRRNVDRGNRKNSHAGTVRTVHKPSSPLAVY